MYSDDIFANSYKLLNKLSNNSRVNVSGHLHILIISRQQTGISTKDRCLMLASGKSSRGSRLTMIAWCYKMWMYFRRQTGYLTHAGILRGIWPAMWINLNTSGYIRRTFIQLFYHRSYLSSYALSDNHVHTFQQTRCLVKTTRNLVTSEWDDIDFLFPVIRNLATFTHDPVMCIENM